MGIDRISNINETISVPPGSRIKIEVPCKVQAGSIPTGCFPAQSVRLDNETVTLVRGFMVENSDVGEVSPVTEKDAIAVWYEHKKPAPNRILFYSVDGRVATISIVNVPVHTHQSITQGGPAYGTYFRDKKSDT